MGRYFVGHKGTLRLSEHFKHLNNNWSIQSVRMEPMLEHGERSLFDLTHLNSTTTDRGDLDCFGLLDGFCVGCVWCAVERSSSSSSTSLLSERGCFVSEVECPLGGRSDDVKWTVEWRHSGCRDG